MIKMYSLWKLKGVSAALHSCIIHPFNSNGTSGTYDDNHNYNPDESKDLYIPYMEGDNDISF